MLETTILGAGGLAVCPYCGGGAAYGCCGASVDVAEARAEARRLENELARVAAMPRAAEVSLALRASSQLAAACASSDDLTLRCQAEHAAVCARYVRAWFDEAARAAGVDLPDYGNTIRAIVAARSAGA